MQANINPLNAELNPICHLLVLLGAHHILHVSRIRVNRQLSQASPCEIYGGQSGTRRGFYTTVSVFLSVYHFTSAVHSISSTSCS